MNAIEYDDDQELTRYVWNYLTSRMTSFERRVRHAIIGREKLAKLNAPPEYPLYASWGRTDEAEVNTALADGHEVYRRRVCMRVLVDCTDIVVNRCPRCERVLRTPLARQCLWCGFDWHAASS